MASPSIDALWRTHNRVHSLIIRLRNAKVEEISSIMTDLNRAAWDHSLAMSVYAEIVKEKL